MADGSRAGLNVTQRQGEAGWKMGRGGHVQWGLLTCDPKLEALGIICQQHSANIIVMFRLFL